TSSPGGETRALSMIFNAGWFGDSHPKKRSNSMTKLYKFASQRSEYRRRIIPASARSLEHPCDTNSRLDYAKTNIDSTCRFRRSRLGRRPKERRHPQRECGVALVSDVRRPICVPAICYRDYPGGFGKVPGSCTPMPGSLGIHCGSEGQGSFLQ